MSSSSLLSTDFTQENIPKWLKIVDWDVKPQSKQTNKTEDWYNMVSLITLSISLGPKDSIIMRLKST